MFTMRMGFIVGTLRLGTSLSGRQGVQPSHSQVRICCWDIAAGNIIVREAGGTTLSLAGK